jgi:RNA polymerase sigma factor (sigma-70 family)
MNSSSGSRTSITLLEQVQRGEVAAWEKFERRYRQKIRAWCRHWNVSRDDVEDVAQVVFAKLALKMRTFVYDRSGSFRAWLKTVTFRAWRDYVESQPRFVALDTTSAEAGQALVNMIEEEFDVELLKEAMTIVKDKVQEKTWEAWRLLALEEQAGKDVAAKLDMTISAVYMAKSRVQTLMRDTIRQLEEKIATP